MKINFDDLKYNLYEILNIPINANNDLIKSSYKKLVLNYHPDKNPDNKDDNDIFTSINIAYKVLKKKETRDKYDSYLINKKKMENISHTDLKSKYKNINSNFYPENKDSAKQDFFQKMQDLNKKHNYNESYDLNDSSNNQQKLNDLQKKRENLSVEFPKLFNNSKFNNNTFNEKFDEFKKGNNDLNLYNQDIIKSDKSIIPSAYQPANNTLSKYGNISDQSYNDLYVDANRIQTDNFTSLDIAFSIKDDNYQINNKSIEEKLKDREIETNKYENMKINDFTEETYEYGIHDKINTK